MSSKPDREILVSSHNTGVQSTAASQDSNCQQRNPELANAEAFYHNNASRPSTHVRKPSAAGLHLVTGVGSPTYVHAQDIPTVSGGEIQQHPSSSLGSDPNAFPRFSHENLGASISPISSISSPALGALNDVTPLPSPIVASTSPDLWRKLSRSRASSAASAGRDEPSVGLLSPSALSTSPRRRKIPHISGGQSQTRLYGHSRERSLSEYVPDALYNTTNERPRVVTGPATPAPKVEVDSERLKPETQLHREENLAAQRKRAVDPGYPTLPVSPSTDTFTTDDDAENEVHRSLRQQFGKLEVRTGLGHATREWKLIRQLGRGAFSQVVLASGPGFGQNAAAQELVALKIVSHDQDGGTDEERMDMGVKREIEILQHISHPCLPRLFAFDDNRAYALLVMNYCSGGDLFELASLQRSVLTPVLIQRIFAELVAAVEYLHAEYIVHRDIKLENVLFNLPLSGLMQITDPIAYAHPFITLTDLGLSKRIPRPPESPLLTHACGSADYAAPELLLQQPYDGRATDVWALGVLLYALLEGRLPFDPVPGQRRQASSKHRIARCDWMWCEYGDEHGEWVDSKGKALEGARDVVEGTLRKVGRGRWDLDRIKEHEWVREGIKAAGGLRVS